MNKNKTNQGFKLIELKLPALAEYVGVARLTLSGIAARMNFSYEDIEDLKVVIAEACNNVVQHAYNGNASQKEVNLKFYIYNQKLTIEILDTGKGFSPAKDISLPPLERGRGFGIFLMKNLSDEFELKSSKEGTKIVVTKYLKS